MNRELGHGRSTILRIEGASGRVDAPLAPFETFDLFYRSLCALMYNYAPTSGHPGGSISCGRIATALVFDAMDYDIASPDRDDADRLSYAAGHKALGLYALLALRNEVVRIAAPDLLPTDPHRQFRLEDLLGFRRNPAARMPLAEEFDARALDGHPTPAIPFVSLATGASGVGLASSIGLAIAARDWFGSGAPRVHIVEGEGGLTPGRVAEALAAAGSACLDNVVLHVDWNQASIDSDHVCREGASPGEYVPWTPAELLSLHDWNVIEVADGLDMGQVIAGQRAAAAALHPGGQPTAIVYRTVKGWGYGIEGRTSHGSGHRLCSPGFHEAVAGLAASAGAPLPECAEGYRRCTGAEGEAVLEECYWEALTLVRRALEKQPGMCDAMAGRVRNARARLDRRRRVARRDAPRLDRVFEAAGGEGVPTELALEPGSSTTLRGELGRALGYLERASGGALFVAAADLLGSTSLGTAAEGFPARFWSSEANPGSRTLATGGICEDAMAGILTGISAFGRHIGVGSSYGAFMAPLGHIAARLHAIGSQARRARTGAPYRPVILVCAHAGLKTGEDGPTHADPQSLQLLQGNFPPGTMITLTPWDPAEIWPLLAAALARRPAIIAPFVTRPSEPVLDRARLGLAPPAAAAEGLYLLRRARGSGEGTLVLQESGVAYAFLTGALPRLEQEGIDLNVYYVASAELFDLLTPERQARLYPEAHAREAMGITGFTLPTLDRWIHSPLGRGMSLHPYARGHFPGSGAPEKVLAEMGLDGEGQYRGILRYLEASRRTLSALAL